MSQPPSQDYEYGDGNDYGDYDYEEIIYDYEYEEDEAPLTTVTTVVEDYVDYEEEPTIIVQPVKPSYRPRKKYHGHVLNSYHPEAPSYHEPEPAHYAAPSYPASSYSRPHNYGGGGGYGGGYGGGSGGGGAKFLSRVEGLLGRAESRWDHMMKSESDQC